MTGASAAHTVTGSDRETVLLSQIALGAPGAKVERGQVAVERLSYLVAIHRQVSRRLI